ncbi:MAG: TIGR01212 family radical SAM protein [Acidobacteria bacterium]|nr:MAG: TIGR01212 family radical SAM protein [Acidobacteriota bacterium]
METVAKLRPSPGAPEVRHSLPGGEGRFRSYNKWLQEKFGERVYKVIVDAGFTCPNRDGTVAVGGCAYCNNNSFRPPSAIKTDPIRDQVREGIEYIRKRFDAHKFIIYFQPFTNTYAETGYLRELYTDAVEHPEVVGLAIGTRPDCVDEEKIRMIDEIAQRTFVSLEFGVESIYDDTLRRVNRGHDYATFLRAMELTRRRSIHIGAHLILGFPWETREQWLAMADEMSRAGVDALKIHHLHLVRGTALAAEYARRPFRVLGYEEYLDLLCDFIERLDPRIVIERMFGEAPLALLVAPNWRRTKNDLVRDIQRRFEERDVWQGSKRGK